MIEALKLDKPTTKEKEGPAYQRIEFHEITKRAIDEALQNPRPLDFNLVNAQQARRILDRIVGYNLSPFLWKKIAKGFSAGRVQSVAVRLIAEREREILAFKPEEYWEILATLKNTKNKPLKEFCAKLEKINGKKLDKLEITDETKAIEIEKNLKDADIRLPRSKVK